MSPEERAAFAVKRALLEKDCRAAVLVAARKDLDASLGVLFKRLRDQHQLTPLEFCLLVLQLVEKVEQIVSGIAGPPEAMLDPGPGGD